MTQNIRGRGRNEIDTNNNIFRAYDIHKGKLDFLVFTETALTTDSWKGRKKVMTRFDAHSTTFDERNNGDYFIGIHSAQTPDTPGRAGVSLWYKDKWRDRIIKSQTLANGRLVTATFNTPGHNRLTIIGVYAQANIKTIEEKKSAKQLEKDLTILIDNYQRKNHTLVVLGDFNSSIKEKCSHPWLQTLIARTNLTDTMSVVHAQSRPYTFCTQGGKKKNIDYILVSKHQTHKLTSAGIIHDDTGELDHSAPCAGLNIEVPPRYTARKISYHTDKWSQKDKKKFAKRLQRNLQRLQRNLLTKTPHRLHR